MKAFTLIAPAIISYLALVIDADSKLNNIDNSTLPFLTQPITATPTAPVGTNTTTTTTTGTVTTTSSTPMPTTTTQNSTATPTATPTPKPYLSYDNGGNPSLSGSVSLAIGAVFAGYILSN